MLTHLGDITIEDFLTNFWQKRPLLIRQAFADVPVIDPDELAGFAFEDEVESRILIETPSSNPMKSAWKLIHGPMDERVFEKLPESNWTLLVQAVDHLKPELYTLRQQFSFIPNWRIDDVMVSYAVDGGNVGPHFDYYDVFLIQALGKREWKIGQSCSSQTPLRSDTECKILKQFDTQDSWVVEPGDMLYIPPGVAHWGVAQGDCVTYSVGFRAPSHEEILLDLTQDLAATMCSDQRFSDPELEQRDNPGLITAADVGKIAALLKNLANDNAALQNWFGCYMTQPKRDSLTFDPPDDAQSISPAARLAYVKTDAGAQLFANGQAFNCSQALAEVVCNNLKDKHGRPISVDQFTQPEDLAVIEELADMGVIL